MTANSDSKSQSPPRLGNWHEHLLPARAARLKLHYDEYKRKYGQEPGPEVIFNLHHNPECPWEGKRPQRVCICMYKRVDIYMYIYMRLGAALGLHAANVPVLVYI